MELDVDQVRLRPVGLPVGIHATVAECLNPKPWSAGVSGVENGVKGGSAGSSRQRRHGRHDAVAPNTAMAVLHGLESKTSPQRKRLRRGRTTLGRTEGPDRLVTNCSKVRSVDAIGQLNPGCVCRAGVCHATPSTHAY